MARKLYSAYVQDGTDILLPILAEFIGERMKSVYGRRWWDEILGVFYSRQPPLPTYGSDDELLDSLDFAACIKIMKWRWNEAFKESFGLEERKYSNYVHELLGVRNSRAHEGRRDIVPADAERALDTMYRLCKRIDLEAAEKIKEVYKVVRNASDDIGSEPRSIVVPPSIDIDDLPAGTVNSLLDLVGTKLVMKTTLTKKLTIGSEEKSYPIYRINLSKLFYNDQNDRVATWFSRYCAENGIDALSKLEIEEYNNIVEEFVVESNPDAIRKTQKNIQKYGQKEPGVTLADGRIVDGNRRFTCLRRIAKETTEEQFFETVLLDSNLAADKKKIKMLELAIQHGEEKRVDYDLIDYAIGTYNDIVQNPLLTIDEYASCTEEPISEVEKRIEIAKIIVEFVEYVKLSRQYYIAREYQIYSVIYEMLPILKELAVEEQELLKRIVFNNVLLQANKDQRKFIRDVKSLVKNKKYTDYFEDQKNIDIIIHEKFDTFEVNGKFDLDAFARENAILKEKLKNSIDKFLQESREARATLKPIENVSKSVSLMAEVDENVFERMNLEERNELMDGISRLSNVLEEYSTRLSRDAEGRPLVSMPIKIAKANTMEPLVICKSLFSKIENESVSIVFSAVKEDERQAEHCQVKLFFVNDTNHLVSSICAKEVTVGEDELFEISLLPGDYADIDYLFLVVQSLENRDNEALRIIPFEVDIF